MAGPDTPHVCLEVHPDVSHFMWAASAKLAEKKATQQAISSDEPVFTMPDDGVDYSEFAVDAWGDDDDTGQSPYGSYVEQQRAACADISFEEIFLALERKGTIWKTERPISAWRGDSNKFMCPDSSHDNPGGSSFSAWGSKEKGLWNCSLGCGAGSGGGDKFVLAYYLYDDFDYHRVAERLAFEFRGIKKPERTNIQPPVLQEIPETAKGSQEEVRPTDGSMPAVAPQVPSQEQVRTGPEVSYIGTTTGDAGKADQFVLTMPPPEEGDDDEDSGPVPFYDWRAVLALSPLDDTFLHHYCEEASKDTTPDQFNLFNGIVALGLVTNNRTTAPDFTPLTPNFGVCLVARSGGGKTRSVAHMRHVLHAVAPEAGIAGVKQIESPASGQSLVQSFISAEKDPVTGVPIPFPVVALIQYDEFSEMAKGTGQTGSILKEKIHNLIDHAPRLAYQSMSSGRMLAQNPFGSVITATQTGRLKDLFSGEDATSGFMNRFLFVMGTKKKQRAIGKVQLNFAHAILALKRIEEWGGKRARSVNWSFDAENYWEQVFDTTIEPLQDKDRRDILTRLDLNLKRLTLAFAINERSEQILLHHVQMALALYPYLFLCYGGVMEKVQTFESNEIADWCDRRIKTLEIRNHTRKLAAWKEKHPECPEEKIPSMLPWGVTEGQLRNEYKQKNWEQSAVLRALDNLKKAGRINITEGAGARGRSTYYYYSTQN